MIIFKEKVALWKKRFMITVSIYSGMSSFRTGMHRAHSHSLCFCKGPSGPGEMPDRIEMDLSGNIIKNVKESRCPIQEVSKGMEVAAVLEQWAATPMWPSRCLRVSALMT